MMRLMTFATIITFICILSGARASSQNCEKMPYVNANEVEYKMLKVVCIEGVVGDGDGVGIPNVCIGLFTAKQHQKIAWTETDENGKFKIDSVKDGEYRLVAMYQCFCTANARLCVSKCNKDKRLIVLMRLQPYGSYIDYDEMMGEKK